LDLKFQAQKAIFTGDLAKLTLSIENNFIQQQQSYFTEYPHIFEKIHTAPTRRFTNKKIAK